MSASHIGIPFSLYSYIGPPSPGVRLGESVFSCSQMLTALVKIIQSVALGILGLMATVLTLNCNERIKDFTVRQGENLSENCANFIANFTGIFALNTPLTFSELEARENRIATCASDVQRRLKRELMHARNQMENEAPKSFRYLQTPDIISPESFDPHTESEKIGNYDVTICHARGRRLSMEDEHITSSFTLRLNGQSFPVQLFGIFDGHGGDQVSKFLKDHLQQKLIETLKEFNPTGLSDEGIWNALKLTCVRLNRELPAALLTPGSTATFALIIDEKIWTANVGDSRTILNNGGKPVQLSEDAKPDAKRYLKGILKRQGNVYLQNNGIPRVNGILAVARAFGDKLLNGVISARPKITVMPLSDILPGSHLILACDGIYEVANTEQITNAVHEQGQEAVDTVAKNIVYSAWEAGSEDNLSIMIVKLKGSSSP